MEGLKKENKTQRHAVVLSKRSHRVCSANSARVDITTIKVKQSGYQWFSHKVPIKADTTNPCRYKSGRTPMLNPVFSVHKHIKCGLSQ